MDDKTVLSKLTQLGPVDQKDSDRCVFQRQMLGVLEGMARELSRLGGDNVITESALALKKQWLEMEDPEGKARLYFTGCGPVGNKIREHVLISELMAGKDASVAVQTRLADMYDRNFVFAIESDEEALKRYRQLIHKCSKYFSGKERMPVIQGDGLLLETLSLEHSGTYSVANNSGDLLTALLYLRFVVQGTVGHLVISDKGDVFVRILHPGEGIWVECSWHFLLIGMLEELESEFDLLLAKLDSHVAGFDVSGARRKLENRIREMMKDEHVLEQVSEVYEKQTSDQSTLTLPFSRYGDYLYQVVIEKAGNELKFDHLLLKQAGEFYEKADIGEFSVYQQKIIFAGIDEFSIALQEGIRQTKLANRPDINQRVTHHVESSYKH